MKTLTLGSHGDTMVPVPSRCTVDGKPLTDLLPADKIEELVVRTRNGGAEVVALLKTGSAYYAPSAAAARMARAVALDSGESCRYAPGSTASTASRASTWASRPIGANGVRKVVETDLTDSELAGAEGGRRGGPGQAGRRRQPLIHCLASEQSGTPVGVLDCSVCGRIEDMPYLLANGTRFAYDAYGKPSSPPIVLLHGLDLDRSSWKGVAEALADDRRVYCPDLRGHGESDRSRAYTYEVMRDDVLAFAEALGLKTTDLIGHSMGATVAWLVAQEAPELVDRLVVEDTQLDDPDPQWWDRIPEISAPTLVLSGGFETAHRSA